VTAAILTAAGMLALGTVIYAVMLYNGLVQLKVNLDKAWGNIDVLLKQRHDEVPNLVACVQGTMKFEQTTLEGVTRARAEALAAQGVGNKAKADQALGSAVQNLFAVAEKYPELRAGGNFLALQKRLTGLENEIADRREFYNDSVTALNTRIQQFPDLVLAGWMKLSPREFFKVDAFETAVPVMSLTS